MSVAARDAIRAEILDALCAIAPETDPASIIGERPLREQVELDSMDFLNVIIRLHERLGIDIPEADYGALATLAGAVDYLAARCGAGGSAEPIRIGTGDALLIVDVQSDFLPGGRLAVPDADAVVPLLNRYIAMACARGVPVIASRDWHPRGHCSFRERGGPWPEHCVAGTPGAGFAPGLNLPVDAIVIDKATTPDADAYSAFDGTWLAALFRKLGVRRLLVGGLATDYCVLATVRDARAAGFEVVLLADAVRAVDARPGDGTRAEREIVAGGARTARIGLFA